MAPDSAQGVGPSAFDAASVSSCSEGAVPRASKSPSGGDMHAFNVFVTHTCTRAHRHTTWLADFCIQERIQVLQNS